jgi:hypothetical protein
MWPSMTPRLASSSEHTTSSLTALALAPGVLNTGMPLAVISATGMLFVPAPHLGWVVKGVASSQSDARQTDHFLLGRKGERARLL